MTTLMTRLAAGAGPEVALAASWWLALRARLDAARHEDGMTTETVIITAGLALLAVVVVGIIGQRVQNRANTIP